MRAESNDPRAYGQNADRYDHNVRWFDIFSQFGFDLSGWRNQAIDALNLSAGDTVIDLGCGTGLNFPLLQKVVTSEGRIIGVDINQTMLEQAGQTIDLNRWQNVELVCADATRLDIAEGVDGVLSTYALILMPECRRVITNACQALKPGGRLSVLDMAWPRYCPLWWRHVLFFLRSYGVTGQVLRARSWRSVQEAMADHLADFTCRQLWFGFFYLAHGRTRS